MNTSEIFILTLGLKGLPITVLHFVNQLKVKPKQSWLARSLARIFPRFKQFTYSCFEFWLVDLNYVVCTLLVIFFFCNHIVQGPFDRGIFLYTDVRGYHVKIKVSARPSVCLWLARVCFIGFAFTTHTQFLRPLYGTDELKLIRVTVYKLY